MRITLSLIIPIYNAKDFIVETIQSVLYEIPNNVEVILVNDGSTDNSVEIIKQNFASQLTSEQLILIEQTNAGVSVARNTGIEQSKGEYISFVDADDLLFNNYYESVFSIINSQSPDIIDIGFRQFSVNADLSKNPDMFTYNNFGLLNTDDVISNIFAKSVFYSWARITKRTVLGDLRFPAGVNFCEDMIFLYQLYQQSERIYHIDKALYAYRDNAAGATRNMKPDYIKSMLMLYNQILNDNRPEISYLKINVFYVIYRCHCELNKRISIPFAVFIDTKKLAVRSCFDKKIPLRKKMILAIPNIHRHLVKLKNYCKSRT
ncbi:glycosyltransferase family 2 protein [Colwellia echini]|uniref:Glycosyltransferase n=1 Tax=Colwellia echini TaxID=1982103 RepID=A0ABY3MU90_9GAMM|nr:glycosyltransferase [Colwellia echini]TYK64776.1 glycosyltransferase [Colwellia echini]